MRTTSYTANNLNEYTNIGTPCYNDIIGLAIATNVVTVNGLMADRKGEYFHREVSTTNGGGPVWQEVTNSAGASTVTGGVVFPALSQALVYDADGNLTFDGIWSYQWDAENRLISMSMNNIYGIANSNVLELTFAFYWRAQTETNEIGAGTNQRERTVKNAKYLIPRTDPAMGRIVKRVRKSCLFIKGFFSSFSSFSLSFCRFFVGSSSLVERRSIDLA